MGGLCSCAGLALFGVDKRGRFVVLCFRGGGLGLGDGQVFATGAMPYQRLDR